MGWQQLVSGFRKKRGKREADKAAARAREGELQTAIERVVDEINPRIRALVSYRKKLRPCVERSLAYCSDLVTRVPESIEVSSKTWGRDPAVKAFFSGTGDLRRVISHSKELCEFFDQHFAADYCYALLSMERRERTVLGMEMHGEVIKRDVKQTAVSFTDHRVVKPSLSEPELRENLKQRAFESLIAFALERITELVAARHLLEEQQQLMEMQRKVAQLRSTSLEPLIADKGGTTIDIEALREQANNARLSTLEDYIDRISDVLGDPQKHLRLDRIDMHLSKMNIKLDEQSTDSGHALQLIEASLGEHLKRTLFIARFPRDNLLPRQDFLA
jgi:hypothetical protein